MTQHALQFLRYLVVGVVSNVGLYLIYLVMIRLGVPYRWAMSMSYVAGVCAGFWAHRQWTFAYAGPGAASAWRFLAAYFSGYLLNLAGLSLLVESGGVGVELSQAVMVIALVGYLYVVQRVWVFPRGKTPELRVRS